TFLTCLSYQLLRLRLTGSIPGYSSPSLFQEENDHDTDDETIDRGCLCQRASEDQVLADLAFCLRLSCDRLCRLACRNTDPDSCSDTCQNCNTCSDSYNCSHCLNLLFSYYL